MDLLKMRSLMLKKLPFHLWACPRGPCSGRAWMSCGIHAFSPSTAQFTTTAKYSKNSTQPYTMIYRLPQIKLLRAVSRLKLLQTGITVFILPPVYYFYLQGDLSLFLVAYSTGIAGFAGVMLYTASYFFRRVVGMMYLDPSRTILKVSHLTFWGKRSDLFLPVSDVMTIADTGDATSETILRLKMYSSPKTFYFSTYYGSIVDLEGFEKVFGRLKS
ncbi:transmembrane protein 186 [Boleophthalmus pectinirostris]|uniref:transmembrane protein 186 n=1 Tax=Boleophthalmus pectinirostris TaxID=150288 RepID=UPI000A1C6692|nr:transmembrane protein 186 [Boleophthalmus pectinirostris]